MLTLVRNIGSSVGISMVIATLTSKTTEMHARLSEYVTPFNDALQQQGGALLDPSTDQGRAVLDTIVTQQATVIAYQNDFKLLMVFTLAMMPLLLFIGTSRARPAVRRPA
jgi:DHA2 family multidrug resistance protein